MKRIIFSVLFFCMGAHNAAHGFIFRIATLPFKLVNNRLGWAAGGAIALWTHQELNSENPPRTAPEYCARLSQSTQHAAKIFGSTANTYYTSAKRIMVRYSQEDTSAAGMAIRYWNDSIEEAKTTWAPTWQELQRTEMAHDARKLLQFLKREYAAFMKPEHDEEPDKASIEGESEHIK